MKEIIIFFRNRDFPANHLEVIDNSSNSPLKWERFARLKLEDNKSFLGKLRQKEAVLVLLKGRVRLCAYTRSPLMAVPILNPTHKRKKVVLEV